MDCEPNLRVTIGPRCEAGHNFLARAAGSLKVGFCDVNVNAAFSKA